MIPHFLATAEDFTLFQPLYKALNGLIGIKKARSYVLFYGAPKADQQHLTLSVFNGWQPGII